MVQKEGALDGGPQMPIGVRSAQRRRGVASREERRQPRVPRVMVDGEKLFDIKGRTKQDVKESRRRRGNTRGSITRARFEDAPRTKDATAPILYT